jgi:hypothetical protein
MSETRQLPKADWPGYFDRAGKALGMRAVQIEVASLDLGDQVEAEWIGLTNLSYDHKGDVLQIGTDHLDHNVHHPSEIWVKEGTDGLESVEIKRRDGITEIVRLEKPLLLPPPRAQG